jgi:hypothetical protein
LPAGKIESLNAHDYVDPPQPAQINSSPSLGKGFLLIRPAPTKPGLLCERCLPYINFIPKVFDAEPRNSFHVGWAHSGWAVVVGQLAARGSPVFAGDQPGAE